MTIKAHRALIEIAQGEPKIQGALEAWWTSFVDCATVSHFPGDQFRVRSIADRDLKVRAIKTFRLYIENFVVEGEQTIDDKTLTTYSLPLIRKEPKS